MFLSKTVFLKKREASDVEKGSRVDTCRAVDPDCACSGHLRVSDDRTVL